MKRILFACLLPTVVWAVVAPPQGPLPDDPGRREREERRRHGGDPTPEYLHHVAAQAEREFGRWRGRMPRQETASGVPVWRNIGPTSLDSGVYAAGESELNAGRPAAIVTHPKDPRILYVAVGPGGVWRCTNADLEGGAWKWEPITDTLPSLGGGGNLSVGGLVMDPGDPRTLYLGLGDSHGPQGVGFYISKDGGDTWQKGGLPGSSSRTHSLIAPEPGVIFLAGTDGVQRSQDGGLTFKRVLSMGNYRNYIWSVQAFTPKDLAAAGMNWNDSTSKWVPYLWYSSDGGTTWKEATLDPSLQALDLSPYAMTLATSPASTTTGWGLAALNSRKLAAGLMRTVDKGATWTFVASPTGAKGLWNASGDGEQATYNQLITVDPTDVNRVIVGANLASYRTLDGGLSWEQLTHWTGTERVYSHADMQVAAWSQAGPKTLFVGNDGGLSIFRDPWRATIPSGSGFVPADLGFVDNRRNRGMTSHLVYYVGSTAASQPADARQRVIAGMQDNSTGMRIDAGSGLGSSTTYALNPPTGDGMGVAYHALNGNKVIASSYENNISNSTDGGTFWRSAIGITEEKSLRQFYTPIVPGTADPTGDTVYTATTRTVYKSTNFGRAWAALPTVGLDPAFDLSRLAAARTLPDTLAVTANDDSNLPTGFLTRNGGQTWTRFGAFPGAGSATVKSVWDVWFNSFDDHVLYATSIAYSAQAGHLFRSLDDGKTWVALDGAPASSNGFPYGIPVYFIRNDVKNRDTLYAGTDLGVYASTNGGQTWARFGADLPIIRCHDLYQAPDGSFMRLATFGRGVWELTALAETPGITAGPAQVGLLTGRPATFRATVTGTADSTATWTASGGQITTSGNQATFSASVPGEYVLRAASAVNPATTCTVTVLVHGADFNTPGKISNLDALSLLAGWGGTDRTLDLTGDGLVNDDDVNLLLSLLGW